MENHISCDGEVSVGACGQYSSGESWSYKAKRGIKQIIITDGDFAINSIKFKDDSAGDYSRTFGGDGGTQTHKVDIDFPGEFLTGISGTGTHSKYFARHLHSLKFYTNQSEYGPFGTESGDPFSLRTEGMITGFHGTSSLEAIGVYLKPICSYFMIIGTGEHSEIDRRRRLGLVPRSPGPWGSINGGRVWDDGVFSAVKRVEVHVRCITVGVDVITAVRFGYQKSDGADFLSRMHGSEQDGGFKAELEIDGVDEFLIGVEGFHGSLEGNGSDDVIRSVTFRTNKESWGPFGSEIGKYFSSMSFKDGRKGKVVGFHGRSGAYVNGIGVHTEYIWES